MRKTVILNGVKNLKSSDADDFQIGNVLAICDFRFLAPLGMTY